VIETTVSSLAAATVLHRITGSVNEAEAERGATEALMFVRGLPITERRLKIMLDLRGSHFVTLQAHRAWSQGFARSSMTPSDPPIASHDAPSRGLPHSFGLRLAMRGLF
jgi:hypothetical protein